MSALVLSRPAERSHRAITEHIFLGLQSPLQPMLWDGEPFQKEIKKSPALPAAFAWRLCCGPYSE